MALSVSDSETLSLSLILSLILEVLVSMTNVIGVNAKGNWCQWQRWMVSMAQVIDLNNKDIGINDTSN